MSFNVSSYFNDNSVRYREKFKMVRSGDFLEIIHYNYGIELKNCSIKHIRGYIGDIPVKRYFEYQRRKKQRVLERIVKLMEINFNKKSVFLTLTFGKNDFDYTNIDITNKYFHKFIGRMRDFYNNFKYIAVPEFQSRGAVHYHLVIDREYIDISILKRCWSWGRSNIKHVYSEFGMAYYFVKYINKQGSEVRLFGKKTMMTSKNLIYPKIYYGKIAELAWYWHRDRNLIPVSEVGYYNSHTGFVLRSKYYHPLGFAKVSYLDNK